LCEDSTICTELYANGIRGDVSNRAAKALASSKVRDEVANEDIYRRTVRHLTNAAFITVATSSIVCSSSVSAGAAMAWIVVRLVW
jgi:hypothetical protein